MFSEMFLAVNRAIRTLATGAMHYFALSKDTQKIDLRRQKIDKILLVRPNFRLGNSILALPSIDLFRRNYPNAKIDFVGSPVSSSLLANLPVNDHYQVVRRFPKSSWAYPVLLMKLRRQKYDLAVEVSGSQSALGAFVVGLSGARFKVGRAGKWDFWYDVKSPKPAEHNKYRLLPAFVSAMGLETADVYPQVILSDIEVAAGSEILGASGVDHRRPIFGIFVGGRKRHGKRWPVSNFAHVIRHLTARGIQVAVFLGPDERELMRYFKLNANVPVILEPSLRLFAAMVSRCGLFLTCDSGPMHVACALGVRTIAIFQNKNFNRWGPPPQSAKILFEPNGISETAVEAACLTEWAALMASRQKSPSDQTQSAPTATAQPGL